MKYLLNNFTCFFTFNIILLYWIPLFVYNLAEVVAKEHTFQSEQNFNTVGSGEEFFSRSLESAENQPKSVDWAYSPIHLQLLVNFELELYNTLNNTQTWTEVQFSEIDWWLSDYKETSLKAKKTLKDFGALANATVISGHPFLTLRMTKRYSRVAGMCSSNLELEFCKMIQEFEQNFALPNSTNVGHIIANILEIQFMYDLSTDDLLIGKFGDIDTGFGVSIDEAFEIGHMAYKHNLFPEALHWFDTVYRRLEEDNLDRVVEVSKQKVFASILELTQAHDELIQKISTTNNDQYHRFVNKINSKHRLETLKEYDMREFRRRINTESFAAYSSLCAGESFQPEIQRSSLHCLLDASSDLAWVINPLKIEVHSWEPYIIQIYDVVGEHETRVLSDPKIVLPLMERESIGQYFEDGSVSGVDNGPGVRTSSSALFSEYDPEYGAVIQKLDRKIGRITQLVVSNLADSHSDASEQFKVTAYPFGGQFQPHMDAVGAVGPDDTDANGGDRNMATFMIYLSDVLHGGNTVFPLIGIYAAPKKGSALFWFNLLRNGEDDARLLHAGCPVLLGEKWIASKWIREHANFQTRKCSLKEFH